MYRHSKSAFLQMTTTMNEGKCILVVDIPSQILLTVFEFNCLTYFAKIIDDCRWFLFDMSTDVSFQIISKRVINE